MKLSMLLLLASMTGLIAGCPTPPEPATSTPNSPGSPGGAGGAGGAGGPGGPGGPGGAGGAGGAGPDAGAGGPDAGAGGPDAGAAGQPGTPAPSGGAGEPMDPNMNSFEIIDGEQPNFGSLVGDGGETVTVTVTVTGGEKGQVDFAILDNDAPQVLHVERFESSAPLMITAPASYDGTIMVSAHGFASPLTASAQVELKLAGEDQAILLSLEPTDETQPGPHDEGGAPAPAPVPGGEGP